jgi:hypothetical protein
MSTSWNDANTGQVAEEEPRQRQKQGWREYGPRQRAYRGYAPENTVADLIFEYQSKDEVASYSANVLKSGRKL